MEELLAKDMDQIDDGLDQTLEEKNPEQLGEQQFDKMMEEWQKQATEFGEDKEIGVEDLMGQWNQVW